MEKENENENVGHFDNFAHTNNFIYYDRFLPIFQIDFICIKNFSKRK